MLAVTTTVQSALAARQGCDSWNLHLDKLSFNMDEDNETKPDALKRVVDSWRNKSSAHLKDAGDRRLQWLHMLAEQHRDRFRRVLLCCESRLLLHLGRASVLENVGLYADRTSGLPLVPGTALKGVLSTWATWEANLAGEGGFNEGPAFLGQRKQFKSTLAREVLGDDSKNGSDSSGAIVFVGGFPADPGNLPRLEADIVTPHPDNGRGRILPNLFLAWGSDCLWQFIFFARPGAINADALLKQTENWLVEALTTVGIGAKTAAGYGRFRRLNQDEQERIQHLDKARRDSIQKRRDEEKAKAALEQLSPEERAYAEYVVAQKDWVAAARDIAAKPEAERQWILRYFRSDAGLSLLKTWTNEKGKKRIENLKNAGL